MMVVISDDDGVVEVMGFNQKESGVKGENFFFGQLSPNTTLQSSEANTTQQASRRETERQETKERQAGRR